MLPFPVAAAGEPGPRPTCADASLDSELKQGAAGEPATGQAEQRTWERRGEEEVEEEEARKEEEEAAEGEEEEWEQGEEVGPAEDDAHWHLEQQLRADLHTQGAEERDLGQREEPGLHGRATHPDSDPSE
eukprot:8366502-Alexandrium_andersonii.AAC.1